MSLIAINQKYVINLKMSFIFDQKEKYGYHYTAQQFENQNESYLFLNFNGSGIVQYELYFAL